MATAGVAAIAKLAEVGPPHRLLPPTGSATGSLLDTPMGPPPTGVTGVGAVGNRDNPVILNPPLVVGRALKSSSTSAVIVGKHARLSDKDTKQTETRKCHLRETPTGCHALDQKTLPPFASFSQTAARPLPYCSNHPAPAENKAQ